MGRYWSKDANSSYKINIGDLMYSMVIITNISVLSTGKFLREQILNILTMKKEW